MTNKKLVIVGAVVAVLLLVGAGVYAFTSMQEKPVAEQSYADAQENEKKPQPNGEVRVASVDNFFTDGSTRQCTFTTSSDTIQFDVQYYFTKGRSLGIISSRPAEGAKATDLNKPSTINQLYKDGSTYVWLANATTGVKYVQTIEELQKLNKESLDKATKENKEKAEQNAKETVITCKPWTVEEAKLTVPGNVEFTSIKD